MASCKECIHYDLCLQNSIAYGFKLKVCSKFKNKADFQEVKHGKFIKPTPCSQEYCNQCGLTPKMVFGILPKYCPHCGAKMDGVKNEHS